MSWPWQDKWADRLEKKVEKLVTEILGNVLSNTETTLSKLREHFKLEDSIVKLKQELETMKIEKGRKEEEFNRRDREIEHKVGLERKRQEFEIQQAKREATVKVAEENLAADKKRFEEQMKFQSDRFVTEVGYLKEMLTEMMKRLPTAEINTSVGVTRKR